MIQRTPAVHMLKEYWDKPIFNVRIGICSPQVSNVDLDTALEHFDRAHKFTTEFMEYVYIYVSDFVADDIKADLTDALYMFNLGLLRHKLNHEGCHT